MRYERQIPSLDGLFRGESDPRMRKRQATKHARSCLVMMSEPGRSTRQTIPGVPVSRAATFGDRGALDSGVTRLWCSGRQPATCTFVPACRHEGEPTTAVGPRDCPLFEANVRLLLNAAVRLPPSGKRCAHQRRQGSTYGHRFSRKRGLRDASVSDFRYQSILKDVTLADLRRGSPAWWNG